jgi:hypothetical protein
VSQISDIGVILHLGGAKCGSSAIQAYLKQNAMALSERGVLVPGTGLNFDTEVTGEQIWYFEEAATEADGPARLRKDISGLMATAAEKGCRTVVISAENICNHATLAPVLKQALAGCETRVVFYVRRQDDFLISSWQQWNLKRFASLEAFLDQKAASDARWLAMILPWAEAFGDVAITVRPFRRDRLKNADVVDDFFDCAGLDQTGLQPLSRAANPSFDDSIARLAHRVRDVFDGPHDNRFYDVLVRLLGKSALKKGSASSLLDLETRRAIVALHADDNASLQARFMPEFAGSPLFEMPGDADVADRSEMEKMSEDIAMLTRCVYELARRSEAGR